MDISRKFPYVVAGYLIVVGLFFIASDILGAGYISPMPPGKYYLYGISMIFITAGIGAAYLTHRGKLRKSGKSVKEVRLEAIENFKDSELLVNIALEEKDEEIKKAAEARLKEIGG